jgi:hypothetical protein
MAQLRMNIIINIKFSANVLLLTIFALFAYSCTKENETTGARIYEGEKIPMSIKMGARNTTADDDEVIKSVRAIVFNDKNELVYNDVSDASINVDNIYIAPIRAARDITTFTSSVTKHRSLRKSSPPLHWKMK